MIACERNLESSLIEGLDPTAEIGFLTAQFSKIVAGYSFIKKEELLPILNKIFVEEELALDKIQAICKIYYP
jgi:hypothetical protein